ncbi:MAG TPA: GNAT family N-acetyltransferase [Candidatus Altiarchaeales archaeon]|nr:GNAT family N-acetyltransferase [Candidatus Altiarchaeales archaeon]
MINNMNEVRIRNVKLGDLKAFIKAYKDAYKGLEQYAYTKTKDIKSYFKWLLRRDSNGFFVCEIDSRQIGFVACDANWFSRYENSFVAEIHELFVARKFQRRGIGSSLLRTALNYGTSKQRNLAELWVGVTNYGVIEFYKRHGFAAKEISWDKWLRMVRKL